MENIPIFPLNTVLFPGIPLRLHIFEDRYKQMINHCLETQQAFGVVLIRQGQEALGPLAEPHSFGTTAQIAQVERIDDGRMNLMAVGRDRFQIASLDQRSKPYLTANVQPYPLQIIDPAAVQEAAERLRPKVKSYVRLLIQSQGGSFDIKRLPEDPVALAFASAALVHMAAIQKQALLEIPTAAQLLQELSAVYRREAALLDVLLEESESGDLPFSKN